MNIVNRDPKTDDLPELLHQLEGEFSRILNRFQIPPQDAEDIVQDLVVLFLTKRNEIESPAAWLAGTLRMRCILFWRTRRRRIMESIDEGLLQELATPGELSQNRDDVSRDLSSAIRHLPQRCQSLLRLRYGLDCDMPEIAKKLGYSATSVRKIASRCLSALTGQILSTAQPLEAAK
ncbi:MAG: RNA polymerase sigma factor [Thermoanaerobaculia bacterium]